MTQQEFYHSSKWRKFRETVIAQKLEEDGELICAECGRIILAPKDCIVHHKERLTDDNVSDPEISLNPAKVEFLHRECHEREHGRLFRFPEKRGIYIVYGPPFAGKSEYVRKQAHGDDLICDFNALRDAIGIERSKALLSPAMQLREAFFGIIQRRTGLWRRAFIVGGYPDKVERTRIKDRLGAEEIFIDVDEETCLSRAKSDSEKEWVEKWFRTYRLTSGLE